METQMWQELLYARFAVKLPQKPRDSLGSHKPSRKGCPGGQKEAEALNILGNTTVACQRLAP